MTSRRLLLTVPFLLASTILLGQGRGVEPSELLKPLGDSWPTYSGDYTGRRYSSLKQINQTTVKSLTLAWTARLIDGPGGPEAAAAAADASSSAAKGKATSPSRRRAPIKGTPLMVDGTIYVTTPDNAWALDARDGRELWHYFWRTRGGTHIANRGFGMWNDFLYMETPDNYLVSLEAKTGKERWHKEIASFNEQYFSTPAPVVVGNHVIAGTGNDLDTPGFLQSFDPQTGELQWKFYTVPMNPGDPGLDTWPSLDAARHGGAQPWLPGRLRSGNEAVHLRHRQPDAGIHAGHPRRGGQPLHELADRGARRHRQDGVVLPDLAARHARLGFGADADPVRCGRRRPQTEAGLDRGAQRLLLHARSRDRRAHRHDQVRHVDQLGARPAARWNGQAEQRQESVHRRVRWCLRQPAAPSTGKTPPTTPTRVSSTSANATASPCTS